MEEDLGVEVVEHFDLIVGTSTGGIIALGLGLGLSPRAIVDFYFDRGVRVFRNPCGVRSVRRLFRAKYSPACLASALREEDVFGERLLGQSKKPLVIPAYSLSEDDVYIFKTDHHRRFRRDWRTPAWQVAIAACAAPTYFRAASLEEDLRLVDGGVWATNPIILGVAEAVSTFECALDDIRVLSLGTTTPIGGRSRLLDQGGLAMWLSSAAGLLMKGQSVSANNQAIHLLGEQDVLRINPAVLPREFELDKVSRRKELMAKAAHESRKAAPDFERRFCDHVAPLWSPEHSREGTD